MRPPLCFRSFGYIVGASPPHVCPFIRRQSSLDLCNEDDLKNEDILRNEVKTTLPEKMPQSGVGSMQGSNEDCLPMKEHTRGGGHTHNVTQRTDTQLFLTELTNAQSHM